MRKLISNLLTIHGKIAFISLFVGTTLGSSAAIGCYADSCADSLADYPATETPTDPLLAYRGHAIGNTWESSSIADSWLPFPAHRTIRIHLTDFLGGQPPLEMSAYISPNQTPSASQGSNFTLAAGNVALFSSVNSDGVTVENNSCTPYFVRVIVKKSAP